MFDTLKHFHNLVESGIPEPLAKMVVVVTSDAFYSGMILNAHGDIKRLEKAGVPKEQAAVIVTTIHEAATYKTHLPCESTRRFKNEV